MFFHLIECSPHTCADSMSMTARTAASADDCLTGKISDHLKGNNSPMFLLKCIHGIIGHCNHKIGVD